MAVTRPDLATYLNGLYSPLLVEAGTYVGDVGGGLKEPMDDAFLATGVVASDLATASVADGDARKLRSLARFFVLDMVYARILSRVDVSMGDPNTSKSRSQMVRQLEYALREARNEAEGYGLNASGWFAGSINLDYLEPDEGVA